MSDPIELDDIRRDRVKSQMSQSEISVSAQMRALPKLNPIFMKKQPGQWFNDADELGLPPHCPVKPLGRDGDACFLLSAAGTVSRITPNASKRAVVEFLFSPYDNYVRWAWPRKTAKDKFIDNFDSDDVIAALVKACTVKSLREGAWDNIERVRGTGAWTVADDDPRLIIHLGDVVLTPDGEREPCEYSGHLYPRRPAIDEPWPERLAGGDGGPAQEMLDILRTWNWDRPEFDPLLMLGWIGMAMMGGALKWRSVVYVNGGFGTGKSSMLGTVCAVLGKLAIKAENATAPAIYRMLNNDASAVILDENEASEDDRKERGLIRLAREAASGALVVRADPSGGAAEFRARSAFLFGSILPPALDPQDYSRMAILTLRPIENPSSGPMQDYARLARMGRQIFKRLVDDWERWQIVFNQFRSAFIEAGHSGRGGDTFGTLAAFAHVMLFDDGPDQKDLDEWSKWLSPASLQELELATDAWRDCLNHIFGQQPDALRNASWKSVGAILDAYRNGEMIYEGGDEILTAETKARKALNLVGLSLIQPRVGAMGYDTAQLFIPAAHPALAKLFTGSKWAGRGVWSAALRQAPRHLWKPVKATFDAQKFSGVAFRLVDIVGDGKDDESEVQGNEG